MPVRSWYNLSKIRSNGWGIRRGLGTAMEELPDRPCLGHGKRCGLLYLLGTVIDDLVGRAWAASCYWTRAVRRAGSRMECLPLHRHQHLGWWCDVGPPRYRRLCRSDQCSIREIQPEAGDR